MSNKLVIVIPVYKEKLDQEEELSVQLCIHKLGCYDMYFIRPKGLNMEYYSTTFPEIKDEAFSKKYFESIDTYNKLMLKPALYKRFEKYEYMLIAQTDTAVLGMPNEMEEFLNSGIDYIGASWKETGGVWLYTTKYRLYHKFGLGKKLLCVMGNGGFSLRNISKTIDLLREKWLWRILWDFNEDMFFGLYGQYNKCGFVLASDELADKFSLEANMRDKLEAGAKPFAVHKWKRYFDTWEELKPYIRNDFL